MPPEGFEPTISAGERPQTYVLDRATTGTGSLHFTTRKYLSRYAPIHTPSLRYPSLHFTSPPVNTLHDTPNLPPLLEPYETCSTATEAKQLLQTVINCWPESCCSKTADTIDKAKLQ